MPHGLKDAYGAQKNVGQCNFPLEFLICLDEMGHMWIMIMVGKTQQTKLGKGMIICVELSEKKNRYCGGKRRKCREER